MIEIILVFSVGIFLGIAIGYHWGINAMLPIIADYKEILKMNKKTIENYRETINNLLDISSNVSRPVIRKLDEILK